MLPAALLLMCPFPILHVLITKTSKAEKVIYSFHEARQNYQDFQAQNIMGVATQMQ